MLQTALCTADSLFRTSSVLQAKISCKRDIMMAVSARYVRISRCLCSRRLFLQEEAGTLRRAT